MAARLETDGSSSALRRVYALASERTPDSPWWRLAMVEVEVAEAEAWNRRRLDAVDRGDRDEERRAMAQARGALERADVALERAQAAGTRARRDRPLPWAPARRRGRHAARARSVARPPTAPPRRRSSAPPSRDPDLVEAWEGLGEVRLRTGDTKGSLEAYLEAAQRSPADARLRVAVGVVLQRIERYGEAAEQFREAALPRPAATRGRGSASATPTPATRSGTQALDAYGEALRARSRRSSRRTTDAPRSSSTSVASARHASRTSST